MNLSKDFNYEEVFMGVTQDRSKGFHKKIYKNKPELRRVVEMIKLKNGRILDIGCGGGLMTECLPEFYPNVEVYGCDVSRSAIKYAKKFGTGKVKYKPMDKKFPYPSNYFDACLSLDVLEHVPDDEFFIKEVRRVLKKNGVFFGAIPCEGQRFSISWFLAKIGFLDNLTFKHVGHIHPEYNHEYIKDMLDRNGFQISKIKFSERLPVQFLRYFQFMLPKEILEYFVGKDKAVNYYDRSVSIKDKDEAEDSIMKIRKLWFKLCKLTKPIDYVDAEYLTSFGTGAWKINVLAVKKEVRKR